jgi:hypothetical protein
MLDDVPIKETKHIVGSGYMPVALPENRVIITVAQTGALITKKMNPHLPEQP